MSFDLCMFSASPPIDADRVNDIYQRLCEGDTSVIAPCPRVALFVQDLTALYPQLDDCPDELIDECPWTSAFDVSEGHAIVCISWSRVAEVEPFVRNLAKKYRLACFDPQRGAVELP